MSGADATPEPAEHAQSEPAQSAVRFRLSADATAEETAAVVTALTAVLGSAGSPDPEEPESGWVLAARLEAQGHPPVSTLRHIAAHATTH